MPPFAVTNKPQTYCAFDHTVDTGTLGANSISNVRQTALADTGHEFTINTESHADVGTHTISVTPVSAKGLPIPGVQSQFTVQIIDPCEDGYLTVALVNPGVIV